MLRHEVYCTQLYMAQNKIIVYKICIKFVIFDEFYRYISLC